MTLMLQIFNFLANENASYECNLFKLQVLLAI